MATTKRLVTVEEFNQLVEDVLKLVKFQAARIDKLERRPSLKYFGIWRPGSYPENAAVTRAGSLWISLAQTTSTPGTNEPGSRAWQLAVKRGADGKDGKDTGA